MASPTVLSPRFSHTTYLVRKKILKLFGGAFHIYDPTGKLAFYSELKAFKLKEDIRVYSDESKNEEVLIIRARNILDFAATYDVIDPTTGEKIGALKRKGMKSILKDEWQFLDTQDREIGIISEDNLLLALIRRFVINLIPQNFSGTVNGQPVCCFNQNFNPFVSKVNIDFSSDSGNLLDRRLGIAAALLLCAIEGKQD